MGENVGLGELVTLRNAFLATEFFQRAFGPASRWDQKFDSSNLVQSMNEGNKLLVSSEFKSIYGEILHEAFQHLGIGEGLVQALPTFRIQAPGGKSVSFHTDEISSGHGKNIRNFWIPLNAVNEQNTLHLVEEDKSYEILKKFRDDEMTLEELDKKARKAAKPVIPEVGQGICFSNRILHGTVVNHSDQVRVSIDFRCIEKGEDLGTRVEGFEFVEFPWVTNNSRVDEKSELGYASVIFQSGRCSHIGHSAQRAVISDFAARKGLSIQRETSEWHHLNHYPTLDELLSAPSTEEGKRSEGPKLGLLIFSEGAFDWQSAAGKKLLAKLKTHGAPVYFCLEDVQVND